jgi:Protein of unknown function (DUF664)
MAEDRGHGCRTARPPLRLVRHVRPPDDDPRTDGGFEGERATLVGFLRDQRLTLELKCAGLGAADLARRSVPPSNLSLLGLVRHLADVGRGRFRRRPAGQGDVLRGVLVHMIEEYARHNGHADFLRERIDGRVGQ